MSHEVELALRLAALPVMGGLAVLAMARDAAARVRVRDDEWSAERAVGWDRLSPEDRARVVDWTYGR
jgi:hypothetical protein